MALRWRRTIDVSPHMFSARADAKDDWLLYCGGWQVGRVSEARRPVEPRIIFVWSLTGPHTPEARVTLRGEAATVAAAKEQLIAAMRAWAVWAGLRRPDGGPPLAPRWVLTAEHRSFDNAGPDDWVMLSGEFLAARAHRPSEGPKRDPHWMLFGVNALNAPGPRAGWADSIDAAKERAGAAWRAWLDWAELDDARAVR